MEPGVPSCPIDIIVALAITNHGILLQHIAQLEQLYVCIGCCSLLLIAASQVLSTSDVSIGLILLGSLLLYTLEHRNAMCLLSWKAAAYLHAYMKVNFQG